MKRIALIVGHSEEKPGAINYLNEHEYHFNLRVANRVQEIFNQKYKSLALLQVMTRRSEPFAMVVPDVRLFKPDLSLELHFNAFSKPARGVEMLVYRDGPRAHDNIRLADMVTDMFADEYGVSERHTYTLDDNSVADGVKVMSEGRGVHNLKSIHEVGVPFVMLIEPVFGNFETAESKAVFEDENRYVNFLVSALDEVRKQI